MKSDCIRGTTQNLTNSYKKLLTYANKPNAVFPNTKQKYARLCTIITLTNQTRDKQDKTSKTPKQQNLTKPRPQFSQLLQYPARDRQGSL